LGARRAGRLRSLAAIAPHVVRHCARPVLIVRLQGTTRSRSA
jgi:nucleotide-binding universal stress UspA family protein